MKVTHDQARELARILGVTKTVDLEQLRQGVEVELEHTSTMHKYAPDANMLEMAAAIAVDHLNEHPFYYTRLKKVEGR